MVSESTMLGKRRLILATVKENVSLTVFDAVTKELLAVVPVGEKRIAKPHEIAVTSDCSRAFVSLYGDSDYGPNKPDNRLGVVDLETMAFDGHVDLGLYLAPHAMMTDIAGKIWVTVEHSRCALIIDPATREIEHTIWLEVPGHFLAASPDGSTVWFSAKEYPVIVGVDVVSRRMVARIPVPVGAQAVRVSPDGKILYAGDLYRPLLHLIDLATREVVETIGLTGVPGWPFNSRDGRLVIVTSFDENKELGYVDLLNANDMTVAGCVEVPAEPFHALPEPDGRHVLVALANGEITRIDLHAGKIVEGGFSAGGAMPEMLLYVNP
ncbi:MAG: YncE family protein [Albidovulum sp.]|nr:YncE family protein [Albidovulum sp.]